MYALFIFILINNLIGMVPYSFASTSHFILTFSLSFTVVLGATVLGFKEHGLKFFSLFVPAGCPLGLLPLLVLIETISYLARNVSLGLRLAANILSGHMLLNILSGFTYNIMTSGIRLANKNYLLLGFIIALYLYNIISLIYVVTFILCIYNGAIKRSKKEIIQLLGIVLLYPFFIHIGIYMYESGIFLLFFLEFPVHSYRIISFVCRVFIRMALKLCDKNYLKKYLVNTLIIVLLRAHLMDLFSFLNVFTNTIITNTLFEYLQEFYGVTLFKVLINKLDLFICNLNIFIAKAVNILSSSGSKI